MLQTFTVRIMATKTNKTVSRASKDNKPRLTSSQLGFHPKFSFLLFCFPAENTTTTRAACSWPLCLSVIFVFRLKSCLITWVSVRIHVCGIVTANSRCVVSNHLLCAFGGLYCLKLGWNCPHACGHTHFFKNQLRLNKSPVCGQLETFWAAQSF